MSRPGLRTRHARTARARLLGPAAYGIVVVLLAACGTAPGNAAPTHSTVTVLAAASLTESFDQLARDFEASHPGATVEVSYGSSATLVQQANQGAPADVLALAGETSADALDRALVESSQVFASNILEIAVPPDNPGRVHDINDLARPDVKVVVCAETVPCGQAAAATFKKARIVPTVVSREIDVKATLAKVKLGEADAAVVYHSDVVAAKGAVSGVAIRPPFNTTLRYPIIALTDDGVARQFVERVLSAEGRATLGSFGLGTP